MQLLCAHTSTAPSKNTVVVHADCNVLRTTLAWVVHLRLAALRLSVREDKQGSVLQVGKADAYHLRTAIVQRAHAGSRSTMCG